MGDADIALRHIARSRAAELARPFVQEDVTLEIIGWIDTQVTRLERRLDKAFYLRVAGELRVLHVEFCLELRADLCYRVYAYVGILTEALRAEAQSSRSRRTAPEPLEPRIESIIVVLSGRRRRLPSRGAYRTSWPGRPFAGARYRIDAVYQRTVAELRARGSLFWLAMTPLAVDATAGAVRDVIAAIRAAVPVAEDRASLYTALVTMANVDPWGHNLRREIETMLDQEEMDFIMKVPFLRENYLRGVDEGQAKGREKGREEMIRKLLGGLFAHRVGRTPTRVEERRIVERVQALGAEQVEKTMLDLEGRALLRWLNKPSPR